MSDWAAVVMAAGKGTRMKSKLPKVLHSVCGRPMVRHVTQTVRDAGVDRVVVVVGSGANLVRSALEIGTETVEQKEQLGTGHAVTQARTLLDGNARHVLVLNGDLPLIKTETVKALMSAHLDGGAPITFLTAREFDLDGYARVIRDKNGVVQELVEDADLTVDQRGIDEINAGLYCFDAQWLWAHLDELPLGHHGESYLTRLIGLAAESGIAAATLEVGHASETIGVDNRSRLARAEALLRERIREHWMNEGVTLIDPQTTYIDADVRIGLDTVLQANTAILGDSKIGEDCEIGPTSIVADSTVGDRSVILASVIEEDSCLADDVRVGPYSHVRGASEIQQGTRIGNFVEVNRSVLGPSTKANHFSYIGDGIFGEGVNIGAGTITCNFDGVSKNPTVIEDNVFIGCDTMLVAPLHVGARAKTGAGSVVTRDVPTEHMAVGMPGRTTKIDPSALPKPKKSKAVEIAQKRKSRRAQRRR